MVPVAPAFDLARRADDVPRSPRPPRGGGPLRRREAVARDGRDVELGEVDRRVVACGGGSLRSFASVARASGRACSCASSMPYSTLSGNGSFSRRSVSSARRLSSCARWCRASIQSRCSLSRPDACSNASFAARRAFSS